MMICPARHLEVIKVDMPACTMAVKVLKLWSACTSNGDLCFSFGRLDAVPRNNKKNYNMYYML